MLKGNVLMPLKRDYEYMVRAVVAARLGNPREIAENLRKDKDPL